MVGAFKHVHETHIPNIVKTIEESLAFPLTNSGNSVIEYLFRFSTEAREVLF